MAESAVGNERAVLLYGPAGSVREACLAAIGADAVVVESGAAIEAAPPATGLVVILPVDDSVVVAADVGQQWDETLDLVLTQTFALVQAAAARMIEGGGGSIVVVSPPEAIGGVAGRVHVCAAAAGVQGFLATAAVEWGRYGVRVNTVVALPTTPSDAVRDLIADRTPMTEPIEPDDVAAAVSYLLSAQSAHVSGALLTVDGGLHAGLITRWHGADYASNALLERGVYSAG